VKEYADQSSIPSVTFTSLHFFLSENTSLTRTEASRPAMSIAGPALGIRTTNALDVQLHITTKEHYDRWFLWMKNVALNLMKSSSTERAPSENAKLAGDCLCQTTIFKASAQKGATGFSKEK
jgi:hypothetical protein